MTPTLYPHEVVMRWFKETSVVTVCITTLVAGIIVTFCSMIIMNITMLTEINDNYLSHSTVDMTTNMMDIIMILFGICIMVLFLWFLRGDNE